MNGEMNSNTCTCKGRLLIPFNLLALSVGILLYSFMHDALRIKTVLMQQMQQAGMQSQQVMAARNHYFGLYSDLVQLAEKDAEASAIVQNYGIKLNLPLGAQSLAPASVPEAPANPQATAPAKAPGH